MTLAIVVLLLSACVYLLLLQFGAKIFGLERMRLPAQVFDNEKLELELTQDKYTVKPDNTWLPLTGRFKDFERRIPFSIEGIRRRLIKAGLPMGVLEFLAFKALSIIFVPVLSLIFFSSNMPKNMILIISLAVGFFIPEMWLNHNITKRTHSIRRDLPNIIDLLNLCVSGGMDFMLAINRVVKDLKPCDLTRELGEVYRETQVGKSRKEALKNFGWRVDMPEVHSFVRTLIQADRMGTPMSEALNVQAEEMRVRRFQHGESMALKAPIKLLFPLFAFILPVVMIIVGGPIILQFVRGGINFGF
ncbi:MAG: type II secretion system F family protein [Candidatus Omnitrophica bacterium]|nr:type II secretion system F family protein [Candidatus Omnitrophota bacterium]